MAANVIRMKPGPTRIAPTHIQDIKSQFELFSQTPSRKSFWTALIWREGMFVVKSGRRTTQHICRLILHCIASSPLEGHPRGHFIMFCPPEGHPRSTLSHFLAHWAILEGTLAAFFQTWGHWGGNGYRCKGRTLHWPHMIFFNIPVYNAFVIWMAFDPRVQ